MNLIIMQYDWVAFTMNNLKEKMLIINKNQHIFIDFRISTILCIDLF